MEIKEKRASLYENTNLHFKVKAQYVHANMDAKFKICIFV